MVWPFSKSSSNNEDKTIPPSSLPQEQKFLDELPPKFDDYANNQQPPSQQPGSPTNNSNKSYFQTVVSSLKPADFAKLHQIPCFRESILTGGTVGGVVFAVLVSTRSAMPRAMNWAMAGFLIGSTVSWEQCRFKIRQEKKSQAMAREIYKNQGGNAPGVGN